MVGFYALAARRWNAATARRVRRNMPEPVPDILLSRLAVDLTAQGAASVLTSFATRSPGVSPAADLIAVRAMLEHAVHEQAAPSIPTSPSSPHGPIRCTCCSHEGRQRGFGTVTPAARGIAHEMAAMPETAYARDGDHHLAYQVVGDSGADLLFVPTATFPIDLLWEEPTVAGHLRRLASFGRLITSDLLGVGSSDAVPISDLAAMQSWTDGLVAVLDAAGSECVSVFAMSESALPAMLLSASHPERVRSLVLWAPFARYVRAPRNRSGCPSRPWRNTSTVSGTPSAPVASST